LYEIRKDIDDVSEVVNDTTTVPPVESPSFPDKYKYHVFLSHSWGYKQKNHKRVSEINKALKKQGRCNIV